MNCNIWPRWKIYSNIVLMFYVAWHCMARHGSVTGWLVHGTTTLKIKQSHNWEQYFGKISYSINAKRAWSLSQHIRCGANAHFVFIMLALASACTSVEPVLLAHCMLTFVTLDAFILNSSTMNCLSLSSFPASSSALYQCRRKGKEGRLRKKATQKKIFNCFPQSFGLCYLFTLNQSKPS